MNGLFKDDNSFTDEELKAIFALEDEPLTSTEEDKGISSQGETPAEGETKSEAKVDTTKAFAKRLKESTDKARSE